MVFIRCGGYLDSMMSPLRANAKAKGPFDFQGRIERFIALSHRKNLSLFKLRRLINMSIKKKAKQYDALTEISALLGPVSFGELIRSLLVNDEASQTDLAEKLEISKQHLSAIENGRKSVSPARAARFAEALGYPAEQFVVAAIEDELRKAGVSIHFDFRKAAGA